MPSCAKDNGETVMQYVRRSANSQGLAPGIEPQVDEKLYFITRYALSKRFAAVIEYISNETTLRFQHVLYG